MLRRAFILAFLPLGGRSAGAARKRSSINDPEWDEKLRRFNQEYSRFVVDLNDGKRNQKQWERVLAAFDAFNYDGCEAKR